MNKYLPMAFLIAIATTPSLLAEVKLESLGLRQSESIDNRDAIHTHTLAARFAKGKTFRQFPAINAWEINLGTLRKASQKATFVSVGPLIHFNLSSSKPNHWFFEMGTHVTLLSKSLFDNHDSGGKLQFKSHLGLGRMLGKQNQFSLVLDYRHISNAGLQDNSLGADLLSLSLNFHLKRSNR